MAESRHGGPPRLAEKILERRLPAEVADAIGGDLHAEYVERVLTAPRLLVDAWYWGQVAALRVFSLRRAARRLAAVRPTHERNGPRRSASRDPGFGSRVPDHLSDWAYAVRRLRRTPGFTLIAILSLALGIGANTAMFSVVNAVLLRELPVTDPDELVEVYSSEADGFAYSVFSHPDFLDVRASDGVFQNVVGTRTMIARIDVGEAPRVAFGELVSWDYFQALGIPMALGRSFVAEEDRTPGTHPVVILGHRTWVRDFGAAPDVLGTSLLLNGRPYTIVGVVSEAYTGAMPLLVSSFFTPLMMNDVLVGSEQLGRRGSRSMNVKARLLDGVTAEQASARLGALAASLAERYPETNENRDFLAVPSGTVALNPLVDRVLRPVAALLLGVVGLVLLIACANLASFLLARAEDRRREIAVRLALGAGRRRLIRQLLTETTLLALLGGVTGIVLAHWTIDLVLAFQPPLPVPIDLELSLDRSVLLFTAAISLLAGIAFGLVPALQATNPDVAPTLKNEGTGTGSRRRVGLRNALVAGQVSISVVLLIGAGLFVRSLQKAQLIDPGFDTGPGAVLWPMPELSGYETPDAVEAFYAELREGLLSNPTVTGVALADRLPLGAAVQTDDYLLPGVPSETRDGDHDIDDAMIGVGYFEAMGVEIVAGRAFSEADVEGAPVVIVSQAFVDRFYPGQDVVGAVIRNDRGGEFRIAGVAADTKVRTLGEAPRPFVYKLQGQNGFFGMQVVVRGSATSDELVAIARTELERVSPDMVLFEEIKTMDEHLALLLFPPRLAALMLSVFGALALTLAAIGVYGVVSYAVSRRTRELGIRMSLGASGRDVVRMSIGGGMRLVLVGGGIGVALAAAVTGWISGYLYGIESTDIVTFASIPAVLAGVALLASWVPARRAGSVDPVTALRSE